LAELGADERDVVVESIAVLERLGELLNRTDR
jgi:hypothetical protein